MSSKRVAIVTGASKGYGAAVTQSLLSEGWTVVGDARDSRELDERARRFTVGDGKFIPVAGDIADPTHRKELVGAATAQGDLSLVVNNAGTLGPSPLPALRNVDLAAVAEVLRVNVIAPLALLQDALKVVTRPGAVFINLTSDAAVENYEGWGTYSLSKAALEKVGAVMATEETSIRIYSLDPGDMRTEMHQAAFPGEDISDRALPEESSEAVVRLADGTRESGRYRASELLAGAE